MHVSYTLFIFLTTIVIFIVSVVVLKRLRNEEKRSSVLLEIENKVIHYLKNIPITLYESDSSDKEDKILSKTKSDIAIIKGGLIIFLPGKKQDNTAASHIKSPIFQIWFEPQSLYTEKLKSIDRIAYFQGKRVAEKLNNKIFIYFQKNEHERLFCIKLENLDTLDKTKFTDLVSPMKRVKI